MSIAFSTVERIIDEHRVRGFIEHYDEVYLSRLLKFTSDTLFKQIDQTYKLNKLDDKLLLVLMAINSQHPNGVTPSKLSEITQLSRVQVTRHVENLFKRNWISKKENDSDRRSQYVILSKEGEDFLQTLLPPLQNKIFEAWQTISKDEQQQLKSILTKLLAHMTEIEK